MTTTNPCLVTQSTGTNYMATFRGKTTFMTLFVMNKTNRSNSRTSFVTKFLLLVPFNILILSSLILSGCGYSFRGSESALPPDVKKINIPIVKNQSPEAGLDQLLTEALRDEFERYGALTVVDNSGEADATLETTIVSLTQERGATSSNTDTALQMYAVMVITAELRRSNGALLWKSERLRVQRVFGAESGVVVASSAEFAGGNISSGDLANLDAREVSRGQEQQAFEDLSEQVARTIYSSAVLPEF